MKAALKRVRNNRGLVVPIALIIVLGGALLIATTLRSWPDWLATSQAPLATSIPDGARLVITLRLNRLAERETRNELRRWMTNDYGHAIEPRDWRTLFANFTGREIDADDLAEWGGRDAALIALDSGWAMTIAVRDDKAAQQWVTQTDGQHDGQWDATVTDGRLTATSNAAAAAAMTRAATSGTRGSLTTTADYRRSRDAHAMTGANIEVFTRWPGAPDEIMERLAGPLDCDPKRWLSARIKWDKDKLAIEAVCPRPERPWTPATLAEREHGAIPTDASTLIELTFPPDWDQLHSRLESHSTTAAEALVFFAATTLPDNDVERNIMEALSGTATIWQESGSDTWKVRLQLRDAALLDELAPSIGARLSATWGAGAARQDGRVLRINHPAWPDHTFNASWNDTALLITTDDQRIDDPSWPDSAGSGDFVSASWSAARNEDLTKWLGTPWHSWFANMGAGKLRGHYKDGLYRYDVEVAWDTGAK